MSAVRNIRKKMESMTTPLLLDTMKEAMILLDADKRFLAANRAAYILFPKLKISRSGKSIKDGEWLEWLGTEMPAWEEDCSFNFNHEADDKQRWYEIRTRKIKSRGRTIGWVLLIYDETETMTLITELERLAFTDVLTGIANRRYFMEQAEKEFARFEREKREMCLMILDIDKFKNVNDQYGHPAGDEVLRHMATTIRNSLRPYDLFARFGGEEFILLVTGAGQEDGVKIAERIRGCIEGAEIAWQDIIVRITVSIGIAAIRKEGCTLDDAIRCADMKLLEAKESGRNNVKATEAS